jgi:hypothetical protein
MKVFTGNEKDFTLNPVLWNGSITFAPFFRKNEPVVARMRFESYPDTLLFLIPLRLPRHDQHQQLTFLLMILKVLKELITLLQKANKPLILLRLTFKE